MRIALLLLAACGTDVPSVPDGTYAITNTVLPTDPSLANREGAVIYGGNHQDQLGSVLASLTVEFGIAPIEVSTTAQVTIFHDAATISGPGNVATPFTYVDGHLHVDAGSTSVQITLPGAAPATLDLDHASLWLDPETLTGAFGGAIPQKEVEDRLGPPVVTIMNDIIARDCTNLANPPACGCAKDSFGAAVVAAVLDSHGCTLTLDGLLTASLVMSLIAPDYPPADLTLGMSAELQ